MIVQPEPTSHAGRQRRLFRDAAIVAPALFLVAVVAVAILGQQGSVPPDGASLAPPSQAAGEPGEEDDGSPRPAPSWVPAEAPAFPPTILGLPVRTVRDAQARLDIAGGRPVAVAGWLGELREPIACPLAQGDTRGVFSPLCERRARLVVADPAAANPSAHFHVTLPPGINLPPAFEDPDTARTAAAPVILVGRASPPGATCTDSARGCHEQLTVDAVAWADGSAFDATLLQDAGLLDTPADIAYRRLPAARAFATRGEAAVLLAAVLRPSTVGAVDVEAGEALAEAPPPEGLVWYLRSLSAAGDAGDDAGDPTGRIRWLLLDEANGRRIASGVSGDPARTALAPAVPEDIAGLRVRDVDDAATDANADAPRPIDAVDGFLLAWTEPGACTRPIAGLPAVGCPRQAVLAAEAWQTDGPDGTEPPIGHLHAIVPPGVAIPESAIQVDGSDGVPAEVVAVLRAATRADCARVAECPHFVVERIAWAEGSSLTGGRMIASPQFVLPGDPVGEDPADVLGSSLLLRAVLLDRGQLRIVARAAARAVRAEGEPPGPLWYLRGLEVPADGEPFVRWEVRRAPSGLLVAAGEVR